MRKKKRNFNRFILVPLIILLVVLVVAPLSCSAAGFTVESYNAHTYWESWAPSFPNSPDLVLRWYDILDVPFGTSFARPFDRFVPDSLKDDLFIKGYYSDLPIALYGQQYNANFLVSMTFSVYLSKPILLASGDRLEFYYIPIENRFIDSATNTQVSFNRSQNCQMLYTDGSGSTLPQYLTTTIDTQQNANGYWVTKVLVENYGHSSIEVNTLQISFYTNTQTTYTGTASIGMIFSNVVRINADPDIYPDYGDIENIVGSIDDAVNQWNDKFDQALGGGYDVISPDYSLIIGEGNSALEYLDEDGAIAAFGQLMNNFSANAMTTDIIYGNTIFQNALLWIYSNAFVNLMMLMSCALLLLRVLFGR